MWFTHYETPAHFSLIVRDALHKWIRTGGPVSLPIRFPDLNPLDFYLWGHLKQLVYAVHNSYEATLHQHVLEVCITIWYHLRVCERLQQSMIRQLHACLGTKRKTFWAYFMSLDVEYFLTCWQCQKYILLLLNLNNETYVHINFFLLFCYKKLILKVCENIFKSLQIYIKNLCIYTTLSEKYPTFVFAKTWWFWMKHTCMRLPWTYICKREFFLPANSIS